MLPNAVKIIYIYVYPNTFLGTHFIQFCNLDELNSLYFLLWHAFQRIYLKCNRKVALKSINIHKSLGNNLGLTLIPKISTSA